MLDKDPSNRPSASEVLRNEYVAEHLAVRYLPYFVNEICNTFKSFQQ